MHGINRRCKDQCREDPDYGTRTAAHAAWRAVEGCGYGRVDMRVDGDGVPWVLEVNPSPDISTDAGLANMARAYGWPYDELVSRVVDVALTAAATEQQGRVLVPSDDAQQVA